MGQVWAKGTFAIAICDVCGFRCRYLELREPTVAGRRTGLRVCRDCYDVENPLSFLPQVAAAHGADAQALKDPRPEPKIDLEIVIPQPPGLVPVVFVNGVPISFDYVFSVNGVHIGQVDPQGN